MIAINTDIDHLVETHLWLAERLASRRRALCRLVGDEEALSVAMDGLWTAAKMFRPSRVGPLGFTGFASNCISRKLSDRMRKAKRSRDDTLPRANAEFIPDRREINGPDCRVTMLLSGEMSPETLGVEVDGLRWALARMPTDMVRILGERFGLGGEPAMTFNEIGAIWGIASSTASRWVAEAIEELRGLLETQDQRQSPNWCNTQGQTATDAHSSPSV